MKFDSFYTIRKPKFRILSLKKFIQSKKKKVLYRNDIIVCQNLISWKPSERQIFEEREANWGEASGAVEEERDSAIRND